MNKLFNENCSISEDGKVATKRIKEEIENLLFNQSIDDIRVIGSILQKIVGEAVLKEIIYQQGTQQLIEDIKNRNFDGLEAIANSKICNGVKFCKCGIKCC